MRDKSWYLFFILITASWSSFFAPPGHAADPCLTLTREHESTYVPGETITIRLTLATTCADAIIALGIEEQLPNQWVFISGNTLSGAPPSQWPPAQSTGTLDIFWTAQPQFPIILEYQAKVPNNADTNAVFTGHGIYYFNYGGAQQTREATTALTSSVPREGEGEPEGEVPEEGEGEKEGESVKEGEPLGEGEGEDTEGEPIGEGEGEEREGEGETIREGEPMNEGEEAEGETSLEGEFIGEGEGETIGEGEPVSEGEEGEIKIEGEPNVPEDEGEPQETENKGCCRKSPKTKDSGNLFAGWMYDEDAIMMVISLFLLTTPSLAYNRKNK